MNKRIVLSAASVLIGTAIVLFLAVNRKPGISHVVLISVDTCRADYFSCYGYPRKTTPHVDALSEQAVRFEYVVSPVPITLPAHSSMLTGKIPPAHGVHNNIGYKLAPSHVTLQELLREQGYKTGAIVSAFVLDQRMGLSQGFDTYYDEFDGHHTGPCGSERKGGQTTDLALDWLEKNANRKSFLFLHYYDPHDTYEPPEPYASQYADNLYAGEIAYTDDCIGRVIEKLKELGIYDSTLLIVTGDHGEMLGEHGEEEHTYFIYESAIRVPLLVKLPGQENGHVVPEPVGLVDLFPTICAQLGLEMPQAVQGYDLSPFLKGLLPASYERFVYSESVGPTRIGASSLASVSTGRWKYIQAPRAELYDISVDPDEQNNLFKYEHQRARILADKLKETVEKSLQADLENRIDLDAESIRRLESLGYLAGKSDGELVFDEDQDDPKDYVHVYVKFDQAMELRDEKKYDEAEEMLRGLIPERPEFQEIYATLGEIGLLRGNYDQAVLNYRKVTQFEEPLPLPFKLYNDLAWLQATRPTLFSRDLQEAVRYATTNCERTKYKDPNALDTLSVAYAAAGEFDKAVETAQTAYTLARTMNNRALAHRIASRLELFQRGEPYFEK